LFRLLRDARLFDSRLRQIDGAGNTGTYLIQLVEGKTVQAPVDEKKKDDIAPVAEQTETPKETA
jgi:vacuolar protein sorting-associated protein 54